MIPIAPGLLLGLVLAAQGSARPKFAAAAVALASLALAVRPAVFVQGLEGRSAYGFEDASEILMRHGVSDVVFAWDHEVNALMPASTLERLGDVFFQRSGAPVHVRALTIQPSDDVNRTALAAASGPRPGLIWIYNRNGRTAAAAHAPRVSELDGRWTCQRIGDDRVGSLACWRN
jgi:hypothetical protein